MAAYHRESQRAGAPEHGCAGGGVFYVAEVELDCPRQQTFFEGSDISSVQLEGDYDGDYRKYDCETQQSVEGTSGTHEENCPNDSAASDISHPYHANVDQCFGCSLLLRGDGREQKLKAWAVERIPQHRFSPARHGRARKARCEQSACAPCAVSV